MIPRILSVAGPLLGYVSLGVLLWALYRHRGRLDRSALGVFVLSIAVCFVFVQSGHRVYFDEDIYIQIASNLSRAPVAQLTLLGTPETVEVSTYYKEPVGYPSLLGLVFALFGATEGVAFLLTRVLFAFLVTGVYLLARDGFKQGWMAWIAAMTFLGVPVVLDYSVSAGTDIPMALFTVVGLWGLVSRAPALAVAGLALVVQLRLEAVVLTSLLVLSPTIRRKWKFIGLILVSGELFHLAWLLSAAPAYATAIGIESTFSPAYVPDNLTSSARYLFDQNRFPWGISVLALLSVLVWAWNLGRRWRSRPVGGVPDLSGVHYLMGWIGLLLPVYLVFYAGSFDLNPRYSIQIVVPLILLAVSSLRFLSRVQRYPVVVALAGSLLFSNLSERPEDRDPASFVNVLASDHRRMVLIAEDLGPDSIVLTTEPEVFLNQGISAMNAVFATERPQAVQALSDKYGTVLYYSGTRATVPNGEQWLADRLLQEEYKPTLIESYIIGGRRTALYRIY